MKANTMHAISAAARGRRRDLGLSQAELASRAGVSREWVIGFEAGKPGVELGLVLRILDALDLEVELLVRGGHGQSASVDLDALLSAQLEP